MNLRTYLRMCNDLGQFQHITGANETEEIGALAEFNARRVPPRTLLFDGIPGFQPGWGVVSGTLATPQTLGLALGISAKNTSDLMSELRGGTTRNWISDATKYPVTVVPVEKTQLHRTAVHAGGLNVNSFPTPTWHPNDGGRYIGTGCVILTRDADSGWVNGGAYRIMVLGDDRLALSMNTSRHGRKHLESWWRQGQPCPVVVVPGGDPLLVLLAGASIPEQTSELDVAGAIRGGSLEVFEGEATGLPIPVDCEFAFEGFLLPEDMGSEGPFGEFTGYYAGGVSEVPAITVRNVYAREDPLILGVPMGKPPHDFEFPFVVLLASLIHDAVISAGVTGVRGVWVFYGRQMIVVSLKQEHPGHARQAAHVAAHCGAGAYMARYVIAVDEDIDPMDLREVMWAVMTRSDPATDIDIARRGWGSPIDPVGHFVADGLKYNSRIMIDACIPFDKRESFPKVAATDREQLVAVARRFGLED